jgi:hypothetical protein
VEPITVILQTFKRTDVALRNGGRPVPIYVADDGSPEQHVSAVLEACGGDLLGYHTARRGYGGNANAAWEAADDIGALTFWLEDDWELRQPLDLYAYACLLMETEEIGMVRLGALNLDIRARSWAHGGLVYWKLDKEPHIDGTPVFTGHPSLRHRRYRQAYGDYPTGLLPGETELAYAYQFRQGPQAAPGIVWPADYPANGYFGHIGQIKTETML